MYISAKMPESSPVCSPPGAGHHGRSGVARTAPRPFHADHIRSIQQQPTGHTLKQPNDDNATRMLMNSPAQKIRSNMMGRVPVIAQITPEEEEEHELDQLGPAPEMSTLSSADTMLNNSTDGHRVVTMTGTIKRGKKQPVETVEVQLQISQEELNKMSRSFIQDDKKDNNHIWGLRKGMHILLFSIIFIPFAFISSLFMSFYVGTIGWYNLYLYLSEERTICHKIFLCPLLILFFPFLISFSAVGIAFYASFKQVSWYLSSWQTQVRDYEKGFYGWVFNKIGCPQCAPYEVVVLDDPVMGATGATMATSQV